MPQPFTLDQVDPDGARATSWQTRAAEKELCESSGQEDIYIAVMGVTGAGKSKFISACSGRDVKVGTSLESCTTDVDEYEFKWANKSIHLIDTPGFDDTHRSDREVLEDIASWLATSYELNIKLSGILYLHRISDNKMGGTGLRNLLMFKKLCGDDFYPRVFLVTTMWDKVSQSEGVSRECELIDKSQFWGSMLEKGATTERHWGNRDSAMSILGHVLMNQKATLDAALDVQKELVDQRKRLDETSAGQHFEVELVKQREKHRKEIQQMQ